MFPLRPELLTEEELEADKHGSPTDPYKRHWTGPLVYRAMRGWLFPYLKSRVLPGDFHPIIAYLFTEWKCNLDCHYCWAFDNRVKGMTEDTARRSIDWLHSTTCRVLALMGGEPLLRPQFVHKVIYYAAQKGFWVYLPTNARLLRSEVIDKVADAGSLLIPRLAPWAKGRRRYRGLRKARLLRLTLMGRCPRLLSQSTSGIKIR